MGLVLLKSLKFHFPFIHPGPLAGLPCQLSWLFCDELFEAGQVQPEFETLNETKEYTPYFSWKYLNTLHSCIRMLISDGENEEKKEDYDEISPLIMTPPVSSVLGPVSGV